MKMNHRFPHLPKLLGRLLIALFSIMILTHMVLFVFYAQHNKHAEARINRDLMVQQIINLVEKVNYASPDSRKEIVKSIDIPNIAISMNSKSQFSTQFFRSTTLWKISQVLRRQKTNIQFSLNLGPHQWLNITASVTNATWWFQIFLLLLEIIIVTAIILTVWSINRFAVPLKNVTKAAERLGVDLNAPPLAVYGPQIVRKTAHAMNKMQERIQELIRERMQMLAALSHDLRTPITRMKLRAHYISNPEEHRKTLADLDQMEAMIAETLAFAKNENLHERKKKLDLNSLLSSIQDDFVDMGASVEYHAYPHRVLTLGRSVALKRAIDNLIENAIKYAGSAKVTLKIKHKRALILIEDSGPGIPKNQIEKVFEPFYRGEHSRSRDTGGTGLGLAVARDVIKVHGGIIKLETRDEGGLRVIVSLPIIDPLR